MVMDVAIRTVVPAEAETLTTVAYAAKRYWHYPEEYILLWQADLTVTPEFIRRNPVYCAVRNGEIVGFYALSGDGPIRELEHMWVMPDHIAKGIGARLFDHAIHTARAGGGRCLRIASDPHAEGFYRRMGAQRIGEVPSQPEGRSLPLLAVDLR
jgi:GNAT superfamily N-acetyltransferase